jgi:plastocyanin
MRHRLERRTGITVSALIALVALAGCGSDAKSSSTTAVPAVTTASAGTALAPTDTALAPAGTGGELTIQGSSFSDLTASAGAEISISNKDGVTHTVTAKDGSFDVRVGGGSTETLTIDKPGTYAIFCKIHTSMSGTITIV